MNHWLAAALVALTWMTYGHVLLNDFIDWDDRAYITENERVLGGLTPENIVWAWTSLTEGLYQPLSWMSLQLDAELFGGQPWGFHLTNLLLHTANVLLLFLILVWLTKAPWRAATVAALFAVHPMHVESVAFAAERKDVLVVFFWLLMIAAYCWYTHKPGLLRYTLVVLAFIAGLLSKPMIITAPCVLLLLDFWPLGRAAKTPLLWLAAEKIPLFMLSFLAAGVTMQAMGMLHQLFDTTSLGPMQRLATTIVAYGWYLKTTLVPFGLGLYYPHDPITGFDIWVVVAAAAALLTLTGVAAWCGRRQAAAPVGWLWFLGTLFPLAAFGHTGLQVWADRYTYFPHIGLFIAVVWSLATVCRRVRILGVAGTLILLVFAALTWLQTARWRDAETIWLHTAAVTNDNHLAHHNLAALYDRRGDLDRAIEHFEKASAIRDVPVYHLILARLHQRNGAAAKADFHIDRAQRLRAEAKEAARHEINATLGWLVIGVFALLLAGPPVLSLYNHVA